jgi:hypothetical protein
MPIIITSPETTGQAGSGPTLYAPADTDAVRALISTNLSSADLTDATILSDMFGVRACDMVASWVASLGADVPLDDIKLHRAAVMLTAAFLVRQVPILLSEKLPDYSYQAQASKSDPAQIAMDLAESAMSLVMDASGVDNYPQPPTFGVASGRRGWLVGARYGTGVYPLQYPWSAW